MREDESQRASQIIQSLEEQVQEGQEERRRAEEGWRRDNQRDKERVRKEV